MNETIQTIFSTGTTHGNFSAQEIGEQDLHTVLSGIDTLFTNGIHRLALSTVYQTLELPEPYCFSLILLLMGYATHPAEFSKGRVATKGVIHEGKYQLLSAGELDEMIATYDDPEQHLVLNEAWRTGNYAHYLDWFFSVWSAGGYNPKETEFAEFLGRAGFLRNENTWG